MIQPPGRCGADRCENRMIPNVRACSTPSVTTATSGISRERGSPGGAWQNLNLAPGMWTIPTLLNRPVRPAQGRRTEGIKRLRVGQGLIYATM
jgi:hypothetical protein